MENSGMDGICYREFEIAANRNPDGLYRPVKFGGFEWLEEGIGTRMPSCTIVELSERPPCPLRIVFAPLDVPSADTVEDLLALYRLYSIPEAFVSERLHNVAHSFGSTREEECGFSYLWFHFLCKNVPVDEVDGVKQIVNKNKRDRKELSQADFTWVRSAYCHQAKPPSPTAAGTWSEVTLLVFGAGLELWERFDASSSNTLCHKILEDPCCLFNTVFEVLYARIDRIAWDLADVYSQKEEKLLRAADYPVSAADSLDFVGLYMLAKHQIYLLEGTEAVIATLDAVTAHHERLTKASTAISSSTASEIQAGFRHRRTLFKSTDLRLKSLEKRTQNMINLSFNLVTQADSRVMKADSSSMKTIAVMTLVFLPCTAVATMFSTPFFYLGDGSDGGSGGGSLVMSQYFWLIWVISVPLTLLVMLAWYKYQKRLKIRIIEGVQPLSARVREIF